MDQDLMSATEAARYLRVHPDTLLRYRKRPRNRNPLPALKSGRKWLYRRDALLRWMEREAHLALHKGRVRA